MMTNEQQRIAIAEWMGWKWIKSSNANTWAWFDPKGERQTRWCEHEPAKESYLRFKPDEDLNAINEAEMKLDPYQFMRYYSNLLDVIIGVGSLPEEAYLKSPLTSSQMAVIAPASQRSEALSRTLWPERWEK